MVELVDLFLRNYEEPDHLDESVKEELAAFVERRKAEGGVETDF